MRKIAIASIIITTFACNKADKTQSSQATTTPAKIELPSTPEAVIRMWETGIAQNQFNLAKLISTGKTLETVVTLDSSNSIVPSKPYMPQFRDMVCKETGDKAVCDCLLDDDFGQLKCQYFLIRKDGQWLLQDAISEPIETNVNKKPSRPVQ